MKVSKNDVNTIFYAIVSTTDRELVWLTLFPDLVELVPNLVWFRPPFDHPLHPSNYKNVPSDKHDNILQALNEIIPDQESNPPQIHQSPQFKPNYLEILKKHFNPKQELLFALEEAPSILWTSIVVSIIHLLFDFFR